MSELPTKFRIPFQVVRLCASEIRSWGGSEYANSRRQKWSFLDDERGGSGEKIGLISFMCPLLTFHNDFFFIIRLPHVRDAGDFFLRKQWQESCDREVKGLDGLLGCWWMGVSSCFSSPSPGEGLERSWYLWVTLRTELAFKAWEGCWC